MKALWENPWFLLAVIVSVGIVGILGIHAWVRNYIDKARKKLGIGDK